MFFERQQAEEKLKLALEEKDLLLREIHHRVKNNLQTIISLLNLQSQYIDDRKAQRLFQISTDRVKAMAMVHEKLQYVNNEGSVNMADYLRSVIQIVTASFGRFNDEIRLIIEIESNLGMFTVEKATPCGLIVNELVNNAFKHAFPADQEDAQIRLLMKREGDHFLLSVEDNGKGIPDEALKDEPETLGLDLVKLLGEQLGGDLKFIHQPQGTRVELRFS